MRRAPRGGRTKRLPCSTVRGWSPRDSFDGQHSRRGEALGYLGVAGNAGMATGPALGSWLTVEWGIEWMFIASALIGMGSRGGGGGWPS